MSLLTKEQQTRFALIKKRFTETPKMGPEFNLIKRKPKERPICHRCAEVKK